MDYNLTRLMIISAAILTTTACAHKEPGVRVEVVEVVREVMVPCPGAKPVRPAPLGDISPDAVKALAQVGAKLVEYAGEGQFADQAMAWIDRCGE